MKNRGRGVGEKLGVEWRFRVGSDEFGPSPLHSRLHAVRFTPGASGTSARREGANADETPTGLRRLRCSQRFGSPAADSACGRVTPRRVAGWLVPRDLQGRARSVKGKACAGKANID